MTRLLATGHSLLLGSMVPSCLNDSVPFVVWRLSTRLQCIRRSPALSFVVFGTTSLSSCFSRSTMPWAILLPSCVSMLPSWNFVVLRFVLGFVARCRRASSFADSLNPLRLATCRCPRILQYQPRYDAYTTCSKSNAFSSGSSWAYLAASLCRK